MIQTGAEQLLCIAHCNDSVCTQTEKKTPVKPSSQGTILNLHATFFFFFFASATLLEAAQKQEQELSH